MSILRAEFEARVAKSDGCWDWQGEIDANGYGRYRGVSGVAYVYAHRLAYVLWNGPIPSGLHIDHLCRNRRCVNPKHLQAVTFVENVRRGGNAAATNRAKTHCSQGHAFTPANTAYRKNGTRRCRECDKRWRKPRNS